MRSLGVTVFGNALEGGAADIAASDIVVLGVGFPHNQDSVWHACCHVGRLVTPALYISGTDIVSSESWSSRHDAPGCPPRR